MRKYAFAIAVAAAFAAGQSGAATIDLDGVAAKWGSVVTAGGNASLTGVGTSQLKWGTPTQGQKSGYGFVGLSTDGHDVEEEFQLGTFTHYNNPISSGTSIKETTLSLTVDLMIDGVAKSVDSAFKFFHNETPNDPRPKACANGAQYGVGVNKFGCADQVTFASVLDLLEEFQIGNAIYTMQITGFLVNGVTATQFWTMEKANNSAILMAKFTKVRDVEPPPPPAPVPLPATGLLVLAGLGALAAAKRRKA